MHNLIVYVSYAHNTGMMEIWPKRCTIMMKKSLKYAGPFGLAAILSGCIFVDRSSRVTARQALDDTIKTIKKKKVFSIFVISLGSNYLIF